MEKITKTEFKNLLCKKPSRFICSYFRVNTEKLVSALDHSDVSKLAQIEQRHVSKIQSNAIQFENGSWLYFEPHCKYYCREISGIQFLLKIEESENPAEDANIIVYSV